MGMSDLVALPECPPSASCTTPGSSIVEKVPCALGHYCPAGSKSVTGHPCPPGTYSNNHEASAESDCILCPRGKYCKIGCTIADFVDCPKGHYCPRGSKIVQDSAGADVIDFPCPAGTYRDNIGGRRIEDCAPCPAGKYCVKGTETPVDCPEGYYCPPGTKSANQYPCRAGTYVDTTKTQSPEGCKKCGLGFFCTEHSIDRSPCLPGTYNDFSMEASACLKCPAGSECTTTGSSTSPGTIIPTLCPAGKYSTPGENCILCEIGHFCPELGASEETMKTEFRCFAGMFCNGGVSVYPSYTDNHPCPVGHYCPEAITAPIACPIGTYNPHKGRGSLSDCYAVPAGHYQDEEGKTDYKDCAPGHYCLQGSTTAEQYKCPAGTFRNKDKGASQEDCATCWSGFKCPEGTANPIICDEGYYCPTGTTIPEACPEGTYSDKKGLTDSMACTPCPAGKYCPERGLIVATELCDPGFYCISGSKRPEPKDNIMGGLCPMTGYCIKGAEEPAPCPAGKYMVITGGRELSQCVECLAGSYCDGTSGVQPKGPCDPGHYCPKGSSTRNPNIADEGYYAEEGAINQKKCPFGTFSDAKQSQCDGCPGGDLCNNVGVKLSSKPTCPQGYYCPSYTSFLNGAGYDKKPCRPGTYNPSTGTSSINDCKACTPGKYCPIYGTTDTQIKECAEGYFCLKNSPYEKPPKTLSTEYGICPAGKYCIKGGASPIDCPAGKYSGIISHYF